MHYKRSEVCMFIISAVGLGVVGYFIFGWIGLFALVLPFLTDIKGESK